MANLDNCPFCGGKAILKSYSFAGGIYWIRCEGCEVETPSYFSEAEAVDAWNRRDDDG